MNKKIQVNEIEAAKLWLKSLLAKSYLFHEFLDKVNGSLKTHKIDIEEKNSNSFSFLVAIAVLDCYKLQILFPTKSVEIFTNLENLLKNEFDFDDDAQETVSKLFDLYFDMLRLSQLQYEQNPQYSQLEELSEELIKAWVGKNIKKYYVPNTRTVSPLVCGVLSLYLDAYSKFWSLFNEKYKFVKTAE